MSGKRLSGKMIVRETSCTGNNRRVRARSCPGNVFPGNVLSGKRLSGKVIVRETSVTRATTRTICKMTEKYSYGTRKGPTNLNVHGTRTLFCHTCTNRAMPREAL